MTTLDLEKLAEDVTAKVSALVPDSSVEDDGGGAYLYIPLTDDPNGEYLIAAVPLLFNGEDSEWGINDGNHDRVWESDFTSETDAETVAEWINSIVYTVENPEG